MLETIPLFLSATLALCIAPGPDNLFVLAQASQHGTRAGLLVTLGLCTGLIVHTALVALGVAVIFQTSPLAFTLLKMVGAGYLAYLAVQAFRSAGQLSEAAPVKPGKLYLRGIVMNLTNPKVAIFFLAFLPQFADPAHGQMAGQIMMLGTLFIAATFFVFGAVAVLSGYLSRWLRESERSQSVLNYLASIVFLGLAVRLVFVER